MSVSSVWVCIINGSTNKESWETLTGDGPCGPMNYVTDVLNELWTHGLVEEFQSQPTTGP